MWLRVEIARGGFIWFNLIGTMSQDPYEPPLPPTNCEILAGVTAVAAARAEETSTTLTGQLQDRFVEAPGQPPTNEFGSSGFKPDFREPPGTSGGSPNQVRHYVGIMSNSYYAAKSARVMLSPYSLTYSTLLKAANSREEGNGAAQVADRQLNAVAVAHGVKLAYEQITNKDLVRLIRDEVCTNSP